MNFVDCIQYTKSQDPFRLFARFRIFRQFVYFRIVEFLKLFKFLDDFIKSRNLSNCESSNARHYFVLTDISSSTD